MDLATHPVVSKLVAEWARPTPGTLTGLLFFASLVSVIAVLVRAGRPIQWIPLLELAVFAVVGLLTIRGIVWWALAAPVLVAGVLSRAPAVPEMPAERSWAYTALVIAIVVGSLAVLPAASRTDGIGTPTMLAFAPENLVQAAREAAPGGQPRVRVPDLRIVERVLRTAGSRSRSTPGSNCSPKRSGTTTSR